MSTIQSTAIAQWHDFVTTGDASRLAAVIDHDAIFESPVVHTPQAGQARVVAYLTAATTVLGGPAFHYTGEWSNATGAVLEFETVVDGVTINGVDIIRVTDDGQRIAAFKVMIRPLKAVNLVHQLMAAMLADQRAPSATSSASGVNGSSPDPG